MFEIITMVMHWEIRTFVTRQKIYHKTQLQKKVSSTPLILTTEVQKQTHTSESKLKQKKRATDIWITMYLEILYVLGLNTTMERTLGTQSRQN